MRRVRKKGSGMHDGQAWERSAALTTHPHSHPHPCCHPHPHLHPHSHSLPPPPSPSPSPSLPPPTSPPGATRDVLSHLLANQSRYGMSEQQILDEMKLLLFAGVDTTAATVSAAIHGMAGVSKGGGMA